MVGATADRPRVWVNCAASLDGRLAFAHGARARLSGPEDLARVHRLRAESDAILVGVGTVVLDDPSLRVDPSLVKSLPARPPTRVVVDASGRTPEGARFLDGSVPTIVATTDRNPRAYPPHVRVVRAGGETVDLAQLFGLLRELGLVRLMVEGGSRILASVARDGLFDRWTIYYAPVFIGDASAPPLVGGEVVLRPPDLVRLRLESVERLGEGYLASFTPQVPRARPDVPGSVQA
ncbi:MAG: dihydrofolate reductase family protein [Thermoplasmata archaeon]|nr:dihydrofolate reductase family protein [Thermoplasmata archaeon]